MNNELTVWNCEEASIRTVEIDDEIWFAAKDVAVVLGYSNLRDAVSRYVDEEDKVVVKHDTPGGVLNLTIINESGVYTLIFGSKLLTAKKFKRWVTSVVLPSIRRTGSYSTNTEFSRELQILIQHERMMAQHQKQLDDVQNKVDVIQEIFMHNPADWRKEVRSTVTRIAKKQASGYFSIQDIYVQLYETLEAIAGADLDVCLHNRRNRMLKNGMTQTAINNITKLDITEDDRKLKEIFTAILRDFSAGNI